MRSRARLLMRIWAGTAFSLGVAVVAPARTIHVDATGTGDYPTIQAAIDAASDGDIIILQPGTYTGDGNRDMRFNGKGLTLRSIQPNNPDIVATTIIDCNGTEAEPHRGFFFYGKRDSNATVSGITIINGYQRIGGAIYCDEYCSPTITHCSIVDNSAQVGGGIYCEGPKARPIISNCKIAANSASGASYQSRGGGIACEGVNALIKNCLIIDNSAGYGGGVCFYYCNADLDHCTITRNSATESGNGISCFGDSRPQMTPWIRNSIIWGNSGCDGPDISSNVPVISYSNVEGGYAGIGNISALPLFVSPDRSDYHLSAISPCRDSGDPLYPRTLEETDIDGEPRVMGIRVDMGADEFTDEVLPIPIIEISHIEFEFLSREGGPNPDAQILSISNVGLGTLCWQITKGCSWLDVAPTHGQSIGDAKEVTLSVDISELDWGAYPCELVVAPDEAANGPQIVTVNLYVKRGSPLKVPSEYGTIQAAIDAAVPGDAIVVAPGTYNENINFNAKNITLTSIDPDNPEVVAATIIQGDGATSVVTFSGSEDASCHLAGFTITGGHTNEPQHGGGIRGSGTTAKISNCYITGNSAYRRGGGLFDCDGPITYCAISDNSVRSPATTEGAGLHSCDGPITNCTISNNSSGSFVESGFGGGLYACDGPIANCIITDNSAGGNGGGLYDCDGPIRNCIIVGNRADHYMAQSRGGGLYDCDGIISSCAIKDNLARESGGGLYGCSGRVSNCTINDNKAYGFWGGGLARCKSVVSCVISSNWSARDGGGLSECEWICNCIISNNVADENGAGVRSCGELINCTIVNNRANRGGGGIYCKGNTTVSNSILWKNTATKGNEAYVDTYIICGRTACHELPSTMTVRYSNLQGGLAGVHLVDDCSVTWVEGNIDADPCFADPNSGDYHVKSQAGRWEAISQTWVRDDVTSPCIDAGNPMSPIGHEPFPNGGVINMGAYGGTAEASKSYFGEPICETVVAGDINGDCRVDLADFAIMALHWLEDHKP